jgi:hypothetical protein
VKVTGIFSRSAPALPPNREVVSSEVVDSQLWKTTRKNKKTYSAVKFYEAAMTTPIPKEKKHEAGGRAMAGSKKETQTAISSAKYVVPKAVSEAKKAWQRKVDRLRNAMEMLEQNDKCDTKRSAVLISAAQGASDAVKSARKTSEKKVHRLQNAVKIMKKGHDCGMKLSNLHLSCDITGRETDAEKLKLLVTAIEVAQWENKSRRAELAANNLTTEQGERVLAMAKRQSRMEKLRLADAAAGERATKEAQQSAAFSSHQMKLRSRVQSAAPSQPLLVDAKNSKSARTAAKQANKLLEELKIATAKQKKAEAKKEVKQKKAEVKRKAKQKEAEAKGKAMQTKLSAVAKQAPGQQIEFQNALCKSVKISWVDDAQQRVKGSQQETGGQTKETDFAAAAVFRHQQVAELSVVLSALPGKPKKLSKKAKLRALAASAALAGKAETATEAEASVGLPSYPSASFLGLPEGIREQICRLAVVEKDPVRITPSNHKQPALLRTCQQLRMETLWLFEVENTFCIEVVDYEPVVPKDNHWVEQVMYTMETSGTPKWDKLKKWLQAYHEDGVPGLCGQASANSAAWDVCGQAFEMVLRMRTLMPQMTFGEMGPMLEVWKKTVTLAGRLKWE